MKIEKVKAFLEKHKAPVTFISVLFGFVGAALLCDLIWRPKFTSAWGVLVMASFWCAWLKVQLDEGSSDKALGDVVRRLTQVVKNMEQLKEVEPETREDDLSDEVPKDEPAKENSEDKPEDKGDDKEEVKKDDDKPESKTDKVDSDHDDNYGKN